MTLDEKELPKSKVDQISANDNEDEFMDSEGGETRKSFNGINYNEKDLEAIVKEKDEIINLVEESKDQDPVKQRMLALIKQQQ